MATIVTYHLGGFVAAAPAQNRAERWDNSTGFYTSWDAAGVQLTQRALTAAETARLAAADAATTVDTNTATIRTKAAQALVANDTFLALTNPTTAQAITQVKALTRECNGLIRLLLGALTDVSDT